MLGLMETQKIKLEAGKRPTEPHSPKREGRIAFLCAAQREAVALTVSVYFPVSLIIVIERARRLRTGLSLFFQDRILTFTQKDDVSPTTHLPPGMSV